MAGTTTSSIGAAIAVEGLLLQLGTGTPIIYTTVCNLSDFSEANKSDVVEVTNVGDKYKRRIATLLDIGVCKAKLFWVMTEPTHMNAITSAIDGLRYLWINQILAPFQVVYPTSPVVNDKFYCYITSFAITGKTGGVFEAEIEFTPNDGNPTLA